MKGMKGKVGTRVRVRVAGGPEGVRIGSFQVDGE